MGDSNSENSGGGGRAGYSLFFIIGIVFVILKILEVAPVASWAWVWVLSPFWIGFAVWLFVVVLMLGLVLLVK